MEAIFREGLNMDIAMETSLKGCLEISGPGLDDRFR